MTLKQLEKGPDTASPLLLPKSLGDKSAGAKSYVDSSVRVGEPEYNWLGRLTIHTREWLLKTADSYALLYVEAFTEKK